MNNNQVKLDGMVRAQHCNWQVSNSGSTIKLMWDIKSACLHFFICISLYQAVFMIPLSHLWVFGVNDILNIVCVPSHIWVFATPWTIACYASLSIEFSRQEYWFGLPFLTPGDLSQPGIEPMSPMSPALAATHILTHVHTCLRSPYWFPLVSSINSCLDVDLYALSYSTTQEKHYQWNMLIPQYN